uniref:Prion-inhibition and propagation HeLo domain-containing protein n=1 Tax=Fusarium oxysporum (strain Fo5176) TaxID=660025 RepID=A0A0D2YHA7_FUSOF
MAEIFGVVAGALSVAALFNNVVDCFEYIQLGRNFGTDYQTCQIKLDIARLRLSRWGDAVKINNDGKFTDVNSNDDQVRTAKNTLEQLFNLFGRAYTESSNFKFVAGEEGVALFYPNTNTKQGAEELRNTIRDHKQMTTSLTKKISWALYKQKSLNQLIDDIQKLLDGLEAIFPTQESYKRMVEIGIEEVREEPSLQALPKAAQETDSLFRETAISRLEALSSSTDPRPCRVLPFPRNEDIVLRPKLFAELDMLLPLTPGYHSAALWGLGGSGKTQIALEYAYRRCDDPSCSVFWVHADNETTFTQDYKVVARKLGLDRKLNGEELLVTVRDRIEAEPRWLLIIDNSDDLALFGVNVGPTTAQKATSLLKYIPQGSTGTVLWISRDKRIAGTLVGPRRGIQVAEMTVNEAAVLLEIARNEKAWPQEATYTRALLEELHCLPLAISQAGAYMRRTLTPTKEYMSKLAEGKKRWRILNEVEFDRHRRAEVPNSILETWNISIEQIRQENETAYKVLHILAYLDNQNIPFEIIAAAAKFGSRRPDERWSTMEQELDKAIVRLKEFSFLGARRTEAGEQIFEMHKLVQEAARYSLNMKRASERKRTRPKSRLWDKMRISSEKQHETRRACGKEVEASDLLTRLSSYLYDRGRWREREAVDKRALELRQEILGEKHEQTIRSMASLAGTQLRQGRYHEAEETFIKVLELRQEVLGERHPHTIWSMASLAWTYREHGRYQEFMTMLQEGKASLRDHDEQGMPLLHLRRKKAEEIHIRVRALQEEVLGDKHPDTIWSMAELAMIYREQSRYAETEQIQLKVLALRQEVLGDKHPDTIWSRAELATTYREQGRYNEAEKMSVKVLALQQEVLGETHPDTMRSMGIVATICRGLGRYKEAEQMSIKVLVLQQEVLGERHPDTIRSMGNLAITYREQSRYKEAEQILIRVLALRQELLGERHLDIIWSRGNLAGIYHAQGLYEKAEDI